MPGGDGRGPNGMGSMTGRGAGYCAGYNVPGFINPIAGRGGAGRGFGRFGGGRGRGLRHVYHATGLPGWARYGAGYNPGYYGTPIMTAEQEAEALRVQAQAMQDHLGALNQRIAELEKEKGEKPGK